ncbi:MAG: SDR family NAD(P)-dependent oxidoreductase [Streptosporangiaceae bacterium]
MSRRRHEVIARRVHEEDPFAHTPILSSRQLRWTSTADRPRPYRRKYPARHGCRLVICAHDPAELEQAADELRAGGAEVTAISCDVTDDASPGRLVDTALEQYGRLDIVPEPLKLGRRHTGVGGRPRVIRC